MLLDGRAGEQASSDDSRSSLREEFHQKLQEVVKENPEKASRLYEKFWEILEEEKTYQDGEEMRIRKPRSPWSDGSVKRGVDLKGAERKIVKKKYRKRSKNKATRKKMQNGRRKVELAIGSKKKEKNSLKKKSKIIKKVGAGVDWTGGENLREKEKKKTKRLGKVKQGAVNVTACLAKVIFYSRLNEKKASAISKQVKRIKSNDKIQKSKKNKKSDFNPAKERLLSALGGDASNQTCGGEPFNPTQSNPTSNNPFSQETLLTLMACEAEIEEKCGKQTIASKLTELEACETFANNFKSEFSECFAIGKSIEQSCACVEAISESSVASMQKCDASGDNSAALEAKKSCKAAVGKCKSAEAAAVEGIDTCKGENTCAATATTSGQIQF